MNESLAGKLELTALRARRLLGSVSSTQGGAHESTEGAQGPPGDGDATKLAAQLVKNPSVKPEGAKALAAHIVALARAALDKISTTGSNLTDEDALALESVIHIRGRPALRVEGTR